eukprot:6050506-Amphidinium_carterae.2
MTTFKNWAAEVQIYKSLEDHNLATLMENVKIQTVPINDAGYIDHKLHDQGLGHEDAEKAQADELQRLYTTRTEPIIRRNAERKQRRDAGIQGVDADEAAPPAPEVPDDFEAFTADHRETIVDYTEALQYTQ